MTANVHHASSATSMERAFNRAVRWLADRGISLAGAQTLTVTGRKTGAPQRIPVNPLTVDGTEYLVAPRGNTQWVRNVRVNPTAELRRGRRSRSVRLTEVPAADRAPIIAIYLEKWGWEVSKVLPEGVAVDSDLDTLAAHAADIPVFALTMHG